MMKRRHSFLWGACILFALFIALIVTIRCVDVQPIGPAETSIGMATLNGAVRDLFGSHTSWCRITDGLCILAALPTLAFALLGLRQLIKRKSLRKVDPDLWLLACLYIVLIGAYLFFEICVINYRPVMTAAGPEASFPSSHTMLVTYMMGAAIYQFQARIKGRGFRIAAIGTGILAIVATALGRLISGVHWLTDIVGGLLLGGSLVLTYIGVCEAVKCKKAPNGIKK